MKTKLIRIISVALCFLSVFQMCAYAQVTDTAFPVSKNETELLWSIKLGSSYRDAPSVPVYESGYILTMSKNTLYKLDAKTGKTVGTAQMDSSPSFGYTPVLCAEGKIFCPLENGTVQAFDFDTLSPLWTSTDSLGGQALSPITFHNGMVFTGFWNGETEDASFVCLDSQNGETIWSHTRKGGYYWAEGYVSGNHLVIGGDDGTGGDSSLCELNCFEAETGRQTDTEYIIGDQRSGIAENGGELFFVTKAGYLYQTSINKRGEFVSIKSKILDGASTSTPCVYSDRIYLGIQSSGFSGKLLIVNRKTLDILDSVDMPGYPQSEMLISTAHSDPSQTVYVYSTYNSAKGGLIVVSDTPEAKPTASEIFTPDSESRNYGISTVDYSEDGTLYYKNDSGYIFAVGHAEKADDDNGIFGNIIKLIISFFSLIISLFSQQ